MTVDLQNVDRRGRRAGQAAREVAATVDTAVLLHRVQERRTARWIAPALGVAVAAAAGAIALVAVGNVTASDSPPDVLGTPLAEAPHGVDESVWPPGVGTVGPDGWVEVPQSRLPTPADPQDLIPHRDAFVLATEGGDVWVSGDGFAWDQIASLDVGLGLHLASDGHALFAVTHEGARAWSGDMDGLQPRSALPGLVDIAGGEGTLVAVLGDGRGQRIVASVDGGATWEARAGVEPGLTSIAWDGEGFVGLTGGPSREVVTATAELDAWTEHPSGTLPDGHWALVETEPGIVAVPRAMGEQPNLPSLMVPDGAGWTPVQLPGQGPFVVDDLTTVDTGALVAMAQDGSRPELDGDRLYRVEANATTRVTSLDTGAFGPTAVMRRSFATSTDSTSMVAFGRRRAGQGDGLTVWVHRPPTEAGTGATGRP